MTALCSGKICTIFPEKGALNFWKACTIALEYSPVLIIDEGTSNIDSATEVNIYDFIWTYFPDTTVIFINHRMNFLNKCDKYIEILEGKANVCEKK